MPKLRKRLFVLSFILLIACGVNAEELRLASHVTLSKREIQHIVSGFLDVGTGKEGSIKITTMKRELRRNGVVVYRVKTGPATFLIDATRRRVRAVTYGRHAIPSKTKDGKLLSRKEFVSRFVNVDEEQAVAAARAYIRRHFGESTVEGLRRSVSRKDYGRGFYYGIVWRNAARSDGVFFGNRLFDISVSPCDGTVIAAVVVDDPINTSPSLKVDEAKTIAGRELAALGYLPCAVLRSVRVLQSPGDDGSEKLEWSLSYSVSQDCLRRQVPVAAFPVEICIDDTTGEIVHGPSR